MSNNSKIILGVVIGLVVVCLCAAGAGLVALLTIQRTVSSVDIDNLSIEEPARVNEVAAKIVDLELPEGYREQYAMDLAGFQIVIFEHSHQDQLIILLQAPQAAGSSSVDLHQQL